MILILIPICFLLIFKKVSYYKNDSNIKNISELKKNYYNLALGGEEKISNFYITKRKDSSSILKPNQQNIRSTIDFYYLILGE